MRLLISAAVLLAITACGGNAGEPESSKPAPVEVVKPTPAAPYDRTFAWKAVPGATSYRVVVFNGAGERSFELRDVKGTSIAVAANVGLPAARYSWQVLAFKADQQISESMVTAFEIR